MKKLIFVFFIVIVFVGKNNLSAESGTAYFNRGNDYYKNKNYQAAVNEYTKAIEVDRNDFDAYNNRGIALYQIGKYHEAIIDFNKVLDAQPKDVFAYQSRAITFNTIGLHRDANKDYKKVIELNPEFAYSYFGVLYTSFYISKKEFQQNYKKFSADKELFRSRVWEYALANFILKKTSKKKILEAAGKDPLRLNDLNFTLGFLELIRKNKKNAKKYFNECIKIGLDDSTEYFLSKLEISRL